jgi:rhodanese-related sulfurtransferase
MPRTHALGTVLGLLLLGAAPATAQEAPVSLIGVVEVHRLLDEGARRVLLIDVRSRPEYQARHIKGALSVPLNEIEQRAGEIPRQGLVVLY